MTVCVSVSMCLTHCALPAPAPPMTQGTETGLTRIILWLLALYPTNSGKDGPADLMAGGEPGKAAAILASEVDLRECAGVGATPALGLS